MVNVLIAGGAGFIGSHLMRACLARGDKVTGVRTKSGWRMDCDVAASNGDLMHTYKDLLTSNKRGERGAAALKRKSWSPI